MTTVILDGYLAKDTDNGKVFYYSDEPEKGGDEWGCRNMYDLCVDIGQLPAISLDPNKARKCKITIEIED